MQWNVEGKEGIGKGEHWCSSGLWRQIEGVHVNHQWRTSSSCWCSPGLSDLWVIWSLAPGHTWTINRKMLRTILMWPWSMGREILKPPRLWCRFLFCCQSDFKGGVWRLIAAVQQPNKSWGSQMNVFLSEYNIFNVWFDLSDYKIFSLIYLWPQKWLLWAIE